MVVKTPFNQVSAKEQIGKSLAMGNPISSMLTDDTLDHILNETVRNASVTKKIKLSMYISRT